MGKKKRRTPSVRERRFVQTLLVLAHSHIKAPPGQRAGAARGVSPPGLAGIPPEKGSGCPPARPQSSLSASSSPASPLAALAARPAHSSHSFVRVHACARLPLTPAPQILVPHNPAAREHVAVPPYTQNQPLHTHIPPATPISVALPSLTYPGSGGAEPSLSPIFFYQGMRFFSLCAGQSREPFLGSSWGRGCG